MIKEVGSEDEEGQRSLRSGKEVDDEDEGQVKKETAFEGQRRVQREEFVEERKEG